MNVLQFPFRTQMIHSDSHDIAHANIGDPPSKVSGDRRFERFRSGFLLHHAIHVGKQSFLAMVVLGPAPDPRRKTGIPSRACFGTCTPSML